MTNNLNLKIEILYATFAQYQELSRLEGYLISDNSDLAIVKKVKALKSKLNSPLRNFLLQFFYYFRPSLYFSPTTTNSYTFMSNQLPKSQQEELLKTLKTRFEKNMNRHTGLNWADVLAKLERNMDKLWSLHQMESTSGEPDVIEFDAKNNAFIFCDCSAESPKGRRSVCYDQEALKSRKEHKPKNSALGMAAEMDIALLNEEYYWKLQKLGTFDAKTSSWVVTPENIRKLGGALFCDCRYATIFTYHNGAESYYAARGFRGLLKV